MRHTRGANFLILSRESNGWIGVLGESDQGALLMSNLDPLIIARNRQRQEVL